MSTDAGALTMDDYRGLGVALDAFVRGGGRIEGGDEDAAKLRASMASGATEPITTADGVQVGPWRVVHVTATEVELTRIIVVYPHGGRRWWSARATRSSESNVISWRIERITHVNAHPARP